MSRLKGADLGVVNPTLASLGAAKSTAGVGLPPFGGRNQGDQHYDTTAQKEYVLTGVAAGTPFSDDFNRPNSVASLGTSSSGTAWSYSAGTPYSISNNKCVIGAGGSSIGVVDVGGTTQEVSASWTFGAGSGSLAFWLDVNSTALTSAYRLNVNSSGNFQVSRNGTQVVSGANNGGYSPVTGRTDRVTVKVVNGAISYKVVTGTGTVYDYGVVYTDGGTPLSGTMVGLEMGGATSGSDAVDDFSAIAVGSLAWTPAVSAAEAVNTANSGTAVTLPDVDTATLHRITLTGTATITLPPPAAGKSFTVVAAQDGTGSRTLTFSTPSGNIKVPGATAASTWAPTVTPTASKVDIYSFLCVDGTNWIGLIAGQNA